MNKKICNVCGYVINYCYGNVRMCSECEDDMKCPTNICAECEVKSNI